MEAERQAKEAEEKAKQDREKKVKEQFGDANAQWEQDKSGIQNLAEEARKEKEQKVEVKKEESGQDSKKTGEKVEEQPKNNQFRVAA